MKGVLASWLFPLSCLSQVFPVAQANFKFVVLLPWPPEHWDCRCAPAHITLPLFLFLSGLGNWCFASTVMCCLIQSSRVVSDCDLKLSKSLNKMSLPYSSVNFLRHFLLKVTEGWLIPTLTDIPRNNVLVANWASLSLIRLIKVKPTQISCCFQVCKLFLVGKWWTRSIWTCLKSLGQRCGH